MSLPISVFPASQNGMVEDVSLEDASVRKPMRKHQRQLSYDSQHLLDRLDEHERRLEQIVQPNPDKQGIRSLRRLDTPALLERLDMRSVEVEQLLQAGADLLASDDDVGCQAMTSEALSDKSQFRFDHDCHSTEFEQFSETGSTTASSCADSCSASSSPRSFILIDDDEENVFDGFSLSLAAEELKHLHREIHGVRKQLSASQIERLTKAVEVLTGVVHTNKWL